MRAALAIAGALVSCGHAMATGLAPAAPPAEAVKLLATYCIETDAKAARAEAVVTAMRLAPDAVTLQQVAGGVALRLALGGGSTLELDIEAGGQVRSCGFTARLSDPESTFAALQQRYQIGGGLDEYEPGNKAWTDIVSPGGTALAMHVTFAPANSLTGDKGGSMTVVVMPAGG